MSTPLTEPALPQSEGGHVVAVLLAGGGGRRLGGTDKARIRSGGVPLLEQWIRVLAERGMRTAVVGPEHLSNDLPQGVLLTREDPPLGGPAAAVRAGLFALEEAGVLNRQGMAGQQSDSGQQSVSDQQGVSGPQRVSVLLAAVDVVEPAPLLDWLLAELPRAEQQAVVPVDSEGRLQYLASLIPQHLLLERAHSLTAEDATGKPLRILLKGVPAVHPQMPAGLGADVDTPEDARLLNVQIDE